MFCVNIGNGIIYDEDVYDEDLYDEDVYPEDDPEAVAAAMNSSRSGGMGLKHSSRSRSFRHHHEEEAQSSRSRSARQQPEQETHYHSSRATQPNHYYREEQDSRGCSYPVQQASSYDNEDDNANERNSVLKQNVIVDGHQVDFQFALELNEQGFCSSNEPFNTFGSYSFKGMAADDGEAFPTFTVIFPYMSMVDDLTECSTKHIAVLTKDRRGMLFWYSPRSKDPTLSESLKNCKKYLGKRFEGKISPITLESIATIVENLEEIQESEVPGHRMQCINVIFPKSIGKAWTLKLQDPLVAMRNVSGLSQHLVLTDMTSLPSANVLDDHGWLTRSALFVLAVEGGKKRGKGPPKLQLSHVEEEMIKNTRMMASMGLGHGCSGADLGEFSF